jgi:Na+-translocating ferredoxin:NAD+ oxidoreductase RnfG subunit
MPPLMITNNKALAFAAVLGSLVSVQARAEIYMNDLQATAVIFPGIIFERSSLGLSAEEIKIVQEKSGQKIRGENIVFYRAKSGETVFIDQVLGKHEFIRFAVGLNKLGEVAGVEILEYRESYGHQIRKPDWRAQFKGKSAISPLELDKDIQNISGATLSSAHVTGGIKRLVWTYDAIKKRI